MFRGQARRIHRVIARPAIERDRVRTQIGVAEVAADNQRVARIAGVEHQMLGIVEVDRSAVVDINIYMSWIRTLRCHREYARRAR